MNINSENISPSILRTNHVPSPEERNIIQSLISLHQERARSLDAKVERAEAALHALHLEQRVQRDLLAAHQALLTPMRRLIPDVLLQIFRHCQNDACDAPMRLAQVSRQWRELTLTTPTLWNTILFHGSLPTAGIVPLARACAERSGLCDLRLSVTLTQGRQDVQRARRALLEGLQILARHVHRWRSFEVQISQVYRPVAHEIMVSIAPRLRRLVWVVGDVQTSLPFSSFPDLRELRSHMLHSSDIPLVLQCTKLRYFCAGGPCRELTLGDCWTILSNCPCLETFDVSGIKASPSDIGHKKRLTVPRLSVLRIGPFVPDPAALIHCLDTPSLTHLRLLVGKSMEFDSSCIRRLVHDCRPPLELLSLVNANCEDVASCLPLLTRLKSLLLQQAGAVDLVILGLLEQDSGGRFVCPELGHLGFRLCLFTGTRLIELAKARRALTSGLRLLIGVKEWYHPGVFKGFTIELNRVGEFSDNELDELCELQTTDESGEMDGT